MGLKDIFKNSAFSVFSWVVPVIMTMVTTPIIGKALGVDLYGVYFLLTTILGFTSLVNFGTGDSVIQNISALDIKKDYKEVNNIMNTSFVLNLVSSVVFLVIILGSGSFIITNFVKGKGNIGYYEYILVLMGVNSIINLISNNYVSFFRATNRYGISSVISSLINLFQNILIIVVIKMGHSMQAIVLATLLSSLILLLLNFIAFKKAFTQYRFSFKIHKKTAKRIFKFSLYGFFVSLLSLILFNSDKLFLGFFCSNAVVAYYSVPAQLSMKVQQFVSSALHITFPMTSSLIAESKSKELKNMFVRSLKFVTVFVVSFSIPAVAYSKKLMLYWMGNDYGAKSGIILQILLLAYGVMCFSAIPYYFFYGFNLPKKNFIYSAISGVLNLVLNIALIPKLEANGAALATLIGALVNFIALNDVRKMIKVKNKHLIARIYLPTIIAAVPQIIITLLLKYLIINLATVILFGALSLMSFYIFYVVLGLYDEYEKEIFMKIKKKVVVR